MELVENHQVLEWIEGMFKFRRSHEKTMNHESEPWIDRSQMVLKKKNKERERERDHTVETMQNHN